MPDFANPYIPGQPVDNPKLFFGRRNVFTSLREHLVRGRRVFVVTGARRMGRTSLVRQLPARVPDSFVPVRLELSEENPRQLDWLLRRLAGAISEQLDLGEAEPAWADSAQNEEFFLTRFWASVRASLGDRCLVLLLDGLDGLEGEASDLLEGFLPFLSAWRETGDSLALVLTTTPTLHEKWAREYPRLIGGALTYPLGSLSSEEASRLITWPVDGVLTFDYGVPRRLVELTSGQPYYLQLLCFEVFNRCAPAGWVNQHDLEVVLEGLVSREIPEFRQVWDDSTPQEQATLAALVSLRGSRGVATVRDVQTQLTKSGARVERQQVANALGALVERGILEQLGALSFRFRVELLRDWLADRIDLLTVVRDTRWTDSERSRAGGMPLAVRLRTRKEREKAAPKPEPPSHEKSEDGSEETGMSIRRWWPWALLAAVLAVALAVVFGLPFLQDQLAEPDPTATVEHTAVAQLATATLTRRVETATETAVPAVPVTTAVPSATTIPSPTPTPSATPPVVVGRSVPSIAYHARDLGSDIYSIYVIDSSGTGRTQVTDGTADAFSPTWSPDGNQIAFLSGRDGNPDIWVVGVDGSGLFNLTQNSAKDGNPAWSPDGEWIAFASVRDSPYWEIYISRPDGSEVQRVTWWEDASDLNPAWSPDGNRLAFTSKRDGDWEIYTMDRDGSNLLRLTNDPADDTSPAWSPDGSRIAFESTRDGYTDIYVMPVVGGNAVNVSNAPYSSEHGPGWSPDGSRIVFYSDMGGDWDVYVMASDGSNPVKLTGAGSSDQEPSWRP